MDVTLETAEDLEFLATAIRNTSNAGYWELVFVQYIASHFTTTVLGREYTMSYCFGQVYLVQ